MILDISSKSAHDFPDLLADGEELLGIDVEVLVG